MRVALVLRSAEVQPLFRDLYDAYLCKVLLKSMHHQSSPLHDISFFTFTISFDITPTFDKTPNKNPYYPTQPCTLRNSTAVVPLNIVFPLGKAAQNFNWVDCPLCVTCYFLRVCHFCNSKQQRRYIFWLKKSMVEQTQVHSRKQLQKCCTRARTYCAKAREGAKGKYCVRTKKHHAIRHEGAEGAKGYCFASTQAYHAIEHEGATWAYHAI